MCAMTRGGFSSSAIAGAEAEVAQSTAAGVGAGSCGRGNRNAVARGGYVLARAALSRGSAPRRLVQRRVDHRKRRVVRDSVHAGVGGKPHAGGKSREHLIHSADQPRVNARVLQANLQVVAALAADEHDAITLGGKLFEIDVPDPRHVAAVALLVVHEERHGLRTRVLRDDPQVLVEAGRVLRQIQKHPMTFDLVILQAPVLRVERVDSLRDVIGGAAEKAGRGRHRQQVVDHVSAAERGAHVARPRSTRISGRVRARSAIHRRELQAGARRVRRPRRRTRARDARSRSSGSGSVRAGCTTEAVLEHRGATLAHGGVGDRVLREIHALGHAGKGTEGVVPRPGNAAARSAIIAQSGSSALYTRTVLGDFPNVATMLSWMRSISPQRSSWSRKRFKSTT